jgi:hypothetical protein
MGLCCPPGIGCNAPGKQEPCVLELCREAASERREAALAVARWDDFQQVSGGGRSKQEQRFRRRAYERARDDALGMLLMRAHGAARGRPFPINRRGLLRADLAAQWRRALDPGARVVRGSDVRGNGTRR